MMYHTVTVTPVLYNGASVDAEINENIIDISSSVVTEIISGDAEYYDGEYSFTPTQSTQIIDIHGKTARENIIINPIPQNYGLIGWNGAVLTVT